MRKTICAIASMVFAHSAALAPAQGETASIYKATLAEQGQKTPEVTTEDMRAVLEQSSAVVIDTRTRAEFDSRPYSGVRMFWEFRRPRPWPPSRGWLPATRPRRLFSIATARSARRAAASPTNWRRAGSPMSGATSSECQSGGRWAGPVASEIDGIARVIKADRTAVFLDGRAAADFARGSVAGAHNVPAEELASGRVQETSAARGRFQPPHYSVRARRRTGPEDGRCARHAAHGTMSSILLVRQTR